MLGKSQAFSGFSVDDMNKAKDFYGNILGLTIVEESSQKNHIKLVLGSGAVMLVYAKQNHVPAAYTVLNFPVEDIDAVVDGLIAKGIQFNRYSGQLQTDEKGILRATHHGHDDVAWLTDPAGNILSIFKNISPTGWYQSLKFLKAV